MRFVFRKQWHILSKKMDKGESEGAYYARKGVLGSGETRCFQMIEVELYFNQDKQPVSRYTTGGEFITGEEFEAEE